MQFINFVLISYVIKIVIHNFNKCLQLKMTPFFLAYFFRKSLLTCLRYFFYVNFKIKNTTKIKSIQRKLHNVHNMFFVIK